MSRSGASRQLAFPAERAAEQARLAEKRAAEKKVSDFFLQEWVKEFEKSEDKLDLKQELFAFQTRVVLASNNRICSIADLPRVCVAVCVASP